MKFTDVEVEILMMDGCSERDAKRHLNDGTIVFDAVDFEEHFDTYMKEWGMDEDEIAAHRAMIEDKKPVDGWSIVEDDGCVYYIMYVLK